MIVVTKAALFILTTTRTADQILASSATLSGSVQGGSDSQPQPPSPSTTAAAGWLFGRRPRAVARRCAR